MGLLLHHLSAARFSRDCDERQGIRCLTNAAKPRNLPQWANVEIGPSAVSTPTRNDYDWGI